MATPNPGQPPQAKSVQDWMICVRAPALPETAIHRSESAIRAAPAWKSGSQSVTLLVGASARIAAL